MQVYLAMRLVVFSLFIGLVVRLPLSGQDTLRPLDCVERLLRSDPQLRISRVNVRQQEGRLLQTQAAFDLGTSVNAQYNVDYSPVFSPLGIVFPQVTTSQYGLGANQELDFGIRLNANMGVQSSTIISSRADDKRPQNRGFMALNLTVPLLKNRGSAVTKAPREQAALVLEAVRADVLQSVNMRSADALSAYVEYWYAYRMLETARTSESVASESYNLIAEYVKADIRTRADLREAEQTMLARIGERIAAEQAAATAYAQLVTVMGDSAVQSDALPAPSSLREAVGDTLASKIKLDLITNRAFARRPDIRGLAIRREAARKAIIGAQSDLLPQLDLGLTVGSNGFNFDTTFGRYISAYRDNATPMNVGATISWALPVQNSQARASIMTNEAEYERLTVQEQDVRRQIQINCTIALQRLQRAYARELISMKSAMLAEDVYKDEESRIAAGKSTLVQLRMRQDYVIAAQRELYAVRRDFALAVVQIRFLASLFFKEDGTTVSTTDASLFDLSELTQ